LKTTSTEAVKTYRQRQKEKGLAEIRGLYVKKEDHEQIKRLVRNFIKVEGHEQNNRLAGVHLDD
jgi:hypothetical protein